MQYIIQERNVSFEILKRSKSLCDSWYTTQSDSINVLQSISNVISQRSATYDLPITLEDHGVIQPRLLFNQTESMEALFQKMKFFITKFGDLNDKFHNLELEASRLVAKSLTLPSKSYPLSTESMIQVTAVDPSHIYDMISKLCSMYREEFTYKSILISTLSTYVSTYDQFQNLINRWSVESHIDDQVEKDIVERIKLYKLVKVVLESGK
ncbi:hypothetical protein INT47_001618 [Mucor saturninus]|uniref:Uncharacterized protein n=1 Tax=Mucor saturninus TaxID=64648 RepID=A0A8H7VF68_9FUNG|nr:hypothetical protein INT47_001618 [Mucor saturninus]